MTRVQELSDIAKWLLREAKRRQNRTKLKTGEWDLVPGFCTAARFLPRHSWVELKFLATGDGKELAPDPYVEVLFRPTASGKELTHIEYRDDGSCYVAPPGDGDHQILDDA